MFHCTQKSPVTLLVISARNLFSQYFLVRPYCSYIDFSLSIVYALIALVASALDWNRKWLTHVELLLMDSNIIHSQSLLINTLLWQIGYTLIGFSMCESAYPTLSSKGLSRPARLPSNMAVCLQMMVNECRDWSGLLLLWGAVCVGDWQFHGLFPVYFLKALCFLCEWRMESYSLRQSRVEPVAVLLILQPAFCQRSPLPHAVRWCGPFR